MMASDVDMLQEARDWLADCAWANMDPEDFAELSDETIIAGVDLFYEGGWAAFLNS